MLIDKQLMFCDGMSLVGANATYKCDRTLSLQSPQAIPPGSELGGPHDLGMGRPLEVLCKMKTDLDSAGGNATVKAQLVMADDENLATNPVILGSSEAIAEAVAVAGYQFRCPAFIPPGTTKLFVGVQFVTGGEAVTAGTVNATIPFGRGDTEFV